MYHIIAYKQWVWEVVQHMGPFMHQQQIVSLRMIVTMTTVEATVHLLTKVVGGTTTVTLLTSMVVISQLISLEQDPCNRG